MPHSNESAPTTHPEWPVIRSAEDLTEFVAKHIDFDACGANLKTNEKNTAEYLTLTVQASSPTFTYKGEPLVGSRAQLTINVMNVQPQAFAVSQSLRPASVAPLTVDELKQRIAARAAAKK